MLLSVCVLGYTDKSRDFISRFKNLPYYKKRDSDTEGVRIHTVYVEDYDLLGKPYVHRYEKYNNFSNVLADGDQETNREISIGNDTEWLLNSDGHDIVFEAVDDPEKYLNTLLALVNKGYWIIITSDKFQTTYLSQILDSADSSGARLYLCSDIPTLFDSINNEYNTKLQHHRKVLMEQASLAKPCGFPD